jgi:hypothetical protein
MLLVFVHGWSATNTDTYGGLPEALQKNSPQNMKIETAHLFLGKYVSFSDEVTVDDIARGMQNAVSREILPKLKKDERFACITHSTGGPVVRQWIEHYHGTNLEKCPLGHLIMLAPANHGSALAQLGKGRLARMKFALGGVEPGTGVLDWLELGSDQSWDLNLKWLSYDCAKAGVYQFVLTGQTIDRALYDNLNAYTGEEGSDGVVRVAAASMNYGLIRLVQKGKTLSLQKDVRAKPVPLGVLPDLSHSGENIGIMRSVPANADGSHPTVQWVLKCLGIRSFSGFSQMIRTLGDLTAETQENERKRKERAWFLSSRTFTTSRYCMLVIRLVDDRGHLLTDYDVFFTAGPDYNVNHLPPGFFVDRQRNQKNPGKLTYYIDYDVMSKGMATNKLDDRFGFRIRARPDEGFAHYVEAEHRGTFSQLSRYLAPNQTLMVEIELERLVDQGVFQLTNSVVPEEIAREPSGNEI